MGKASSSKKVQRAARAAASSRGASERRELGFPITVAVVVLLGIGLVLMARSSRDPLTEPRTTDHWHAAYTLYDCGQELPFFAGSLDPDGIHSHNDGLIHIHPFNSSATGSDARVSVFLEAMEATIDIDGMTSPDFGTIAADGGCGEDLSIIKAARWNVDGVEGPELVEVFDQDFGDIRFLGDREAFTFARVAVGDDPPPPSATSLALLAEKTGSPLQSSGPITVDDLTTTTLADLPDEEAPVDE